MKLDDVASRPPEKNLNLTLAEVGLENVQSQVQVQGLLLPAKAYASVSLVDKNARGIHMSRLYKIVSLMHEQELTWAWMHDCLSQMLLTHKGLSDSATLNVNFDMPVLRKALASAERGWRNYPVTFQVSSVKGELQTRLIIRVLYSSTCPCSAGLSRQAMQEAIAQKFTDQNIAREDLLKWLDQAGVIPATPHAQRSEALCRFDFETGDVLPSAISLIDAAEEALGTAVQASVKREDEQEFARRNAQNLMFCEDAARRVKAAFLPRKELADFHIEVRHFESLHPHDVVAKVGKFD